MGISETLIQLVKMEHALEIMGKNTLSIADAVKAFRISLSQPQLTALSHVPYSEKTLTECKDTHILFAVFPLSINNIREMVIREEVGQIFSPKFWYKHEPFALNFGETVWQLIRKTPVPNTFLKTLEEHQSIFLSQDEEIPKARKMVYAIVGWYIAKEERLFENVHVRCSDKDAFGVRLSVSGLGPRGLDITNEYGNRRNKNLCLVPIRKFDRR